MPRIPQSAEGRPKTGPTFSDFQTGVFPRTALPATVGARLPSAPLLFQGKEKFLGILNKYMEIHGTVYYESQRPPEVPAFVKNHGLLPQPEFQQLLRKAKVSPTPSPCSPQPGHRHRGGHPTCPPPYLPPWLVASSTCRPAPACSATLSLMCRLPGVEAELGTEGPGQGQQSRGSAMGKRTQAALLAPSVPGQPSGLLGQA